MAITPATLIINYVVAPASAPDVKVALTIVQGFLFHQNGLKSSNNG